MPSELTAKRLPQSLVPYAVLLVLIAACASFVFYPRPTPAPTGDTAVSAP